MKERSKKQKELCLEKLNSDLKRDLTKSMDYNCEEKERNFMISADMMAGGGPNLTVKRSSITHEHDERENVHMTLEPGQLVEEYHVFKLDEDFTINTADKQMERPMAPLGPGSLFASPAHALNGH